MVPVLFRYHKSDSNDPHLLQNKSFRQAPSSSKIIKPLFASLKVICFPTKTEEPRGPGSRASYPRSSSQYLKQCLTHRHASCACADGKDQRTKEKGTAVAQVPARLIAGQRLHFVFT